MFNLAVVSHTQITQLFFSLCYKRLIVPVILFVLLANHSTRSITTAVLSDAFWQVSAFVAITLAIYHGIGPRLLALGSGSSTTSDAKQVFIASALGCTPGCGGAIIVITQYVQGRVRFGAVVSVLTATMGDAAFLLLAAKPQTGLVLIAITFMVGILSGSCVNIIHKRDFLRPRPATLAKQADNAGHDEKHRKSWQAIFWQILLVPAAVVAVMTAFQLDIDQTLRLTPGTSEMLGAALAIISVTFWATDREVTNYQAVVAEKLPKQTARLFQKIAMDTNFVTSWVILAFLSFELAMYYSDFELQTLFATWPAVVPLVAVLIGFIPGCGPQILTTSLYISDAIPFSAQLGNAISNDGDALFPAIAMVPRAALLATLYSAIPALMLAYGYYWFE